MSTLEQPEAGPSKPRTPPATPSSKGRRRSWFGLVASPFSSGSSPRDRDQTANSPRRNSSAVAAEEGHELADRSSTAEKEGRQDRRRSVARSIMSVEDRDGTEILDINGEVETPASLKKKNEKQKKKLSLVGDEPGEALRLDDLGLRARPSLEEIASRGSEGPGRRGLAPPLPVLPPKPPALSPRSSSLTIPSIRVPSDKSTPPLPTDRPLPNLPPESPAEPTPKPADIVITPSSPITSTRPPHTRRVSASMSETRTGRPEADLASTSGSGSAQGSRSSSQSRTRKTISRKSSLVGLGLPRALWGGNDEPPPVPSKPQSVSSPFPSRPSSPVPKISFAEPDNETQRGRTELKVEKDRAKRGRSLSGIFTRGTAPPQTVSNKAASVVDLTAGAEQSRDREAAAEQADEAAGEPGKIAGVLEWLGVKKAGKRRASEAKAVAQIPVPEPNKVDEKERTGVGDAEEKGETATGDQVEETGEVGGDSTIRPNRSLAVRPEIHNASSSMTVLPDSSNHTSSGLRALGDAPISSPSQVAVPIPILSLRPAVSTPSTPAGQVSPELFHDSPSYVSSPTSAHEDFFFTPPGAPWVDGTESTSHKSSPLSRGADLEPDKSEHAAKVAGQAHGRHRSYSDAPTRTGKNGPSPPGDDGNNTPETTHRQTHRAQTLTSNHRPKLGNRSNSGNSAIIEKMKGVFAKSSARNRSRSRSLLPLENSAQSSVDEFGAFGTLVNRGRPNTASTDNSTLSSAATRPEWSSHSPNASILGLHHEPQSAVSNDSVPGLPPVSLARSLTPASSNPSIRSTLLLGPTSALPSTVSSTGTAPRNRGRASTVSFASSAPQTSFLPPASPAFGPVVSTPPRRRPSAIQRFSSGLLGSSAPSSPKGSLFPLPPRSSGSTFSSSVGGDDGVSSGTSVTSHAVSPFASPRPSTGSFATRSEAGGKVNTVPEDGESASEWLERMTGLIGRDEIAGVLAASGDDLHTQALKLHMAQFDFTHNALDIALRRLLMQMSLPKETQQIDRVIEAFAKRYEACEPGLFGSKDNTYVLAFSMMMLHTDAFNRNNKNKMSKADYVRNTRMNGVNPITLEAFYDNITYTPFVYVDSGADLSSPVESARMSGRSRSSSDAAPSSFNYTPKTPSSAAVLPGTPASTVAASTATPASRMVSASTPGTALGPGKIDVYGMLSAGTLSTLRVDLEHAIPARSPYSCSGTLPLLDMDALQSAFVDASILKVGGSPSKRRGTLTRKVGTTTAGQSKASESENEGEVALRVTKVGVLSRKDDAADAATRKTSRKWRSWSVILTGSQLLFFKDPVWALTLQEQLRTAGSAEQSGKGSDHSILPRVARFVPDEVFPVKDAVAVFDRSLTGNPHTFRFHLAHRAYLIQAPDENEMNDWISLINYSAAFKTAGIRMRAGGIRRDQALLAGTAAAASLRREVRSVEAVGARPPGTKKSFGTTGPAAASWAEQTEQSLLDLSRPITPTSQDAHLLGTKKGVETSTPPSILTSSRRSGESTGTAGTRSTGTHADSESPLSPVSGKNVLATLESAGSLGKDDGERLGEVFSAVKAELAAETGVVAISAEASGPGKVSGSGRIKPGVRVRIPSSQAVRSSSIEAAIRDIETKRRSAQLQLDGCLTQARNLAILTPFQKTTRDRISTAVQPLAGRIRTERLLIAKYSAWMAVLRYDLEREERDWTRNKEVALYAAEKTYKGAVARKLDKPSEGDASSRTGVDRATSPAGTGRIAGDGADGGGGDEEGRAVVEEEDEAEEILDDANDADHADTDDNTRHSEDSSLASTPRELPVLIRPPSSDALQGASVTGTISPDAASRPTMRRHASASSAVHGSVV